MHHKVFALQPIKGEPTWEIELSVTITITRLKDAEQLHWLEGLPQLPEELLNLACRSIVTGFCKYVFAEADNPAFNGCPRIGFSSTERNTSS